jgi:general stress protein CsbA
MSLKFNNWVKVFLVFICLIASVVGFMIKLPRGFRHFDKELHAAFYFLAAAFLNVLFTNGKITRHILIFVILYLFSISIEYAQEYSNKFFRVRIHGRFDPEDLKYNLRGLIAYSLLWISYRLALTAYNKLAFKTATNNRNSRIES